MNKQPLIALDLELEQSYTNHQTPDSKLDRSTIIQLGWIVYECDNGNYNVLKESRHYVNINVPLSDFIKKLTHITDEQISSGGTLLEAYDELVSDQKEFNTIRVVRQWGGGDMTHLKMELDTEQVITPEYLDNYKWEFGGSGFNVKHLYQAYALANDLNTSGGLSKCLGRCNLPWNGQGKHDALVDAINTAQMYAFLENEFKPKYIAAMG